MQGQKRAIGSLPEGVSFDHGSSSSGAGVDEQIYWNSMRNSAQNRLTGYNISPSNTSDMYLNSTIQEGQNLSGWNTGEPSSSATQNQPSHGDRKTEHGWSSSMKACVGAGPNYDAQQFEATSMLTLDDDSVNLSRNQIANGPLFMQSSSSDSIPHDLNTNSAFASHGVVERRVMECPNAFKPGSSERLRLGTAGSSSDPFRAPSGGSGGYVEEETDSRSGCSSEGRRLSCKRKALEVNIGQSSDSGSSNFFQRPESVWHAVPSRRNASSSLSISTSAEDSTLGTIPSEQIIPRLGLGVGVGSSENPIVLGSPGPVENSRRNFRLRINASHQQDAVPTNNVLATGSSVGHANPAAPYPPSRLLALNNNHADLRSPAAAADNSSPQSQSVLRAPVLRRNMQSSRWNRSSSSRASRSSNFLISGVRDTQSSEEPISRSMPRNISEHPMFVSATETRNSAQNGFMWSSTGGNVIATGNVASTSRAGSSSGVHPSSAPNWAPHRSSPHYPRRLSEMVRRSLLSSTDFEAGGQSNNVTPPASGTSAPMQEVSLPSGAGNQGHHHLPNSRSALLLDRQLDGAFGLPYSLRTLAAAGDGRSRLVSEIRNVLDLMRRGEGLRFEDVMILDQSVFYGVADVHDRHRDMRLDVDNMSYEELLALEERIGNVNTGLTEETISNCLKRRKYTTVKTGQQDPEPCSICREEYNNGEDLGALECGHDFHTDCIKQWLMQKNLCPICKSAGLAT